MFRKAQNVSIRILEPCDLGAGWRGPDPHLILLHEVVALETYSGLSQVFHRRGDIRDLPAQYRSMGRRKLFTHSQAQHDAVSLKHQRERRLFTHQPQTERVAVEFLRAGNIDNGDEPDDVVLAKSGVLTHLIMMSQFPVCGKTAITSTAAKSRR